MLVGGTAFSTAGGIKIARTIIIFKLLEKRKSSGLKDIMSSYFYIYFVNAKPIYK
jgi:Trk-type K+ transport system membrane component